MSNTVELRTIVNNYKNILLNLQVSDRQTEHMIGKLTTLASTYVVHGATLVRVTEEHLFKVRYDRSYDLQLLVIRLIDSIVKNIEKPYAELFSKRIVQIYQFVLRYIKHREDVLELKRLKDNWQGIFSEAVLKNLDSMIAPIESKFPGVEEQSKILLVTGPVS